jgi:hypothetical protein
MGFLEMKFTSNRHGYTVRLTKEQTDLNSSMSDMRCRRHLRTKRATTDFPILPYSRAGLNHTEEIIKWLAVIRPQPTKIPFNGFEDLSMTDLGI